MIPEQILADHILDLYGHETAHLDRERQIEIGLECARKFNETVSELLAERDAERVSGNSGTGT